MTQQLVMAPLLVHTGLVATALITAQRLAAGGASIHLVKCETKLMVAVHGWSLSRLLLNAVFSNHRSA